MLDIPYHRIDQFQKGTNEFAVVNIWAFIPSPVIIVDHYTSPAFPFLAEEPGKQGNQSDTDEGHTATGHQLLHTLRLCTGVIIAGLRSASVRAKRRSTGPAAPFQKVDRAPDTKTCTEGYYQSLQYADCTVEKCHKFVLLCPDPKYSWWITGPSVMKNVDITKPSSKLHVHLQPEKGRKIARTDDQSVLAM
jgi:hypothetical protein